MLGELLRTLEELVAIRTVNDPVRGERPGRDAAEAVCEVISRVTGAEPEIVESRGFYTALSIAGSGRPVVLAMAHYDTVPADPSEWSSDPFRLTVRGERAYGRGALDDKGNVASLLHGLGGLARKPPRGTLVLAVTGDEEVGGLNGALRVREALEAEGLEPDYVVNADGHGLRPIVRRRGVIAVEVSVAARRVAVEGERVRGRATLEVYGRETRHAAYFMAGVDRHPLIALSQEVRDRPDIVVSELRGGWVKSNVLPSWVEYEGYRLGPGVGGEADEALTRLVRAVLPVTRIRVRPRLYSDYGLTVTPNVYSFDGGVHRLTIDIRAMDADPGEVRDAVREVLEEHGLGSAAVEVRGGHGYLHTPRDARIVVEALEVCRDLGIPAEPVEMCGASDSRYFSPRGVECVDFGPLGGNVHGPDEYVVVPSLEKAALFYRGLVERLLRRG